MILFDYIYYRIAKFFFKRDGSHGFRAIGFLTIMQSILLICAFFLALRFFLTQDKILALTKSGGKIAAGLSLMVMFITTSDTIKDIGSLTKSGEIQNHLGRSLFEEFLF